MNKISNLLWGTLLIVIGVIIGLNALEITNINLLFDGWWCFLIIIPCFIDLFKEKEKTGNIIGIVIGLFLFLACQDFINFDVIWKLLIPFILIMIGLSFIFKDVFSKNIKNEMKKISKSKDEYISTFSAQKINIDEEFKGCELNAVFGSTECDLKNAIINKDVVIEANAIFGIVTIYVPENINVKITSTPIFGTVSDERKEKVKTADRTIYIKASALFGGVVIKWVIYKK